MTNDEGRKPEGTPERSPKAGAGVPSGVDVNWPKRNSVRRKLAVVARLLRGEPLVGTPGDRSRLKCNAGWTNDQPDRMLPELNFIALDDLRNPPVVLGTRRHGDHQYLAALPRDSAAAGIAPLAPGVEDRKAIGEAWSHFGGEKPRPSRFAHPAAAKQQVGHHPRLLHAAALKRGLSLGRRETRKQHEQSECRRPRAQHAYPLTRSIAAPQAPSLSSSRSKPRSR